MTCTEARLPAGRTTRSKRASLTLLVAALWLAYGPQPAAAEGADAAPAGRPEIVDLGGGRLQLGSIRIDRSRQTFSVPGTVLAHDKPGMPMEFLAGTKGGYKNYESVFELDTDAVRFNLACLLIGLDPAKATHPGMHFDRAEVSGDPVAIFVSWQVDGQPQRIRGEEALLQSAPASAAHEWVYTGSVDNGKGQYLADVAGTLVGFVHDMSSVIHHRSGLGIGNYGAVLANVERLPPPGTQVTLEIERLGSPGAAQ